jgi:hypothetical protein
MIYILLSIFFIFILVLQVKENLLYNNRNFHEGFDNPTGSQEQSVSTYQPYDTKDPNNAIILAQQNAGNIQVLKQQMDDLYGMKQQVLDLSNNIITLQGQVNDLVSSQQDYATQMVGSTPPQITGTGADLTNDTTSVETFMKMFGG